MMEVANQVTSLMYRVMFYLLWTTAPLQLIKYTRRYKEDFDLQDAEYDTWLRVHHRDHLRVTTQPDTGNFYICQNLTSYTNSQWNTWSPSMDLLNVPVPKTSWTKTMTIGKACVLKSAECLKALQEKETIKRYGG